MKKGTRWPDKSAMYSPAGCHFCGHLWILGNWVLDTKSAKAHLVWPLLGILHAVWQILLPLHRIYVDVISSK